MSLYVPNIGELEMMRSILLTQEWILGLCKNAVSQDGSLSMLNIQELPSGGGRGYASKTLSMEFATSPTANKWYMATNAAGKAEAQYSNDYLEWEFNSNDVADGNTVYGIFAYTHVVPFDTGSGEVKVGDTVTGAASGATGVVTGVVITSGSWGGGNAAGYFFVKNKSGVFQNDENLQVGGVTKCVSNTGTLYGGDAHKQLLFVESLPTPQPIDVSGRKIRVLVKWTLKSE